MDPNTSPVVNPPVDIQNNPPSKKTLIIALGGLGILVIIIFIILMMITSSSEKEEASVAQSKQVSVEKSLENSQGTPEVSDQDRPPTITPSFEDPQTYKNPQYSIIYSPEWKIQQTTLAGGEKESKIEPKFDAYDSSVVFAPVFKITTGNLSAADIEKSAVGYVARGFKRDSIKVDNTPAIRLKGGSETTVATASATNKGTQETHIFVSKAGASYHMEYSYISPVTNQYLESTFMEMVNSFNFVRR